MKRYIVIPSSLFVVLCAGMLVIEKPAACFSADIGAANCDWSSGEPYKMHWPQPPDLSPAGVDIDAMGVILADDFKCTATGPVSRIHVWASFADDLLPSDGAGAMTFTLTIYSDVPAATDLWSRPDERLWTRVFNPGEYTVRLVHEGPEGWYEPITNTYQPANHRQAYQYNFCIDSGAFIQQEGTIYWLAVEVQRPANTAHRLGWKTTNPENRWNDDAVYRTVGSGWLPMVYPKGHEYADQTLDLAFVINGGQEGLGKHDLGDAPDSSNSFPGAEMIAYPSGVVGNFPTIYAAGSPPYGPIHWQPDAMVYLGRIVTHESEADLGFDQDLTNNLLPLADLSDLDGGDDGVQLPLVLPHCGQTTFDFRVTFVQPLINTPAYVNVWFDWDRDGDWDDTPVCPDGADVPEWAVQNASITSNFAGSVVLPMPPFLCWHPETGAESDPMWMRITISLEPWGTGTTAAAVPGSGPAGGYEYGETEDYLLYPQTERAEPAYDWGDAPDGLGTPEYPTLSANAGAQHVVAGPWFGDDAGVPDADSDGQPDPDALDDDNDGNDDEEGVCIPPLIRGETAVISVKVGGGGGIVQAWIDFNADTSWDAGEEVFNGFLPNGDHLINVAMPNSAAVGQSFARFRISTDGGLSPAGAAKNGEVEDYDVSIRMPPPDVKWVQWPDLTQNGIDIRLDDGDGKIRWIADDFECTTTNLITEIYLWGSWKNDQKGAIKNVHVSIHPDDPVGSAGPDPQNRFSKPAPEVLWARSFAPGQFDEVLYHIVCDPGEWWWDPATGELIRGGDTEVWRLDLHIDPQEAFLQQGSPTSPVIYWLEVRVETSDGQFGWKTRRWPDHYMDDAVWAVGVEVPRAWNELRYPKDHPYYTSEKNSIDMAFQLGYTGEIVQFATTRPGSVTQCPAVQTQCPAVETRCPPIKTQCPMLATRCPTVKTKCPSLATQCRAIETKCPAVKTKCPPVETKCPPLRTKCPLLATRCPAQETKCPPVKTRCPLALTKCPPTPTQCTLVQTQCPAVPTECPVAETQCPPLQTKCPPLATRCPVVATECPPVTTQCPAVQTECPPTETRCPPSQTRCPPLATRCPVVATTCPPVTTACPPVQTECPPVETRCPPSQTKCPPFATRCPAVATECPPVITQCPAVQTECPPVETYCPAEQTKCPPVETYCPAEQTKCPPKQTYCPAEQTKCPPANTRCPVVTTECPAVATYCPAEQTKCPPKQTYCPAEQTKCPPTNTRCPVVTTECPVVATYCPAEQTKCPPKQTYCPAEQTKCPPVDTRCPVESTKCPALTTRCPPVQTTCPTVDTRCPPEQTKCPVVATECPTALTKCPATPTQCAVVQTQCPALKTQCPPVDTYCPAEQTKCPVVATECPASLTRCPATPTLCVVAPTQCPAVKTICPRCPILLASPPTTAECPAIDVICPSVVAMGPPGQIVAAKL